MGKYVILLFVTLSIISCDSKPKVIVADGEKPSNTEMSIQNTEAGDINTSKSDVHQVIANEILNTERYTYINVTEGTRTFWIATAKMQAEKGKNYMYRGGLMKVNFESQEFKRSFDTIYLVSQVIDGSQHPTGNMSGSVPVSQEAKPVSNVPMPDVKDAVKLSDIFKNREKFKGQVITVVGEVTKVNNGIMDRNWVHIKDGSKDVDLTITTKAVVAIGDKVAFKGKITLKKDFGAGYIYDLLMEEGERL